MKKNSKSKIQNSKLLLVFVLVVTIAYVSANVMKDLRSSLFFQKRDRINIVFYGNETRFYSIDSLGDVNYVMHINPNLKVLVPGGYGYYRVGALGKLAFLEKKSDIIQKTFSSLTSSMVRFYFFPYKSDIYFNEQKGVKELSQIFLSNSNAHFFDRIFLAILFLRKQQSPYTEINKSPSNDNERFSTAEFAKTYKGFFYNRAYRNENKSVQIIYTKSDSTALLVSQILEGEGVRIADLAKNINEKKGCILKENEEKPSMTTVEVARFFHCTIKTKEKTDPYDIIFLMGQQENEWEVEQL